MNKSIIELFNIRKQSATKERRQQARMRRRSESILLKHVFPVLPKSLPRYFELTLVTLQYGIGLVFNATKKDDEKATQNALGIITKSVAGLKKAGWENVSEPEAIVNEISKTSPLSITLNAIRSTPKYTELTITFQGFSDTPNCHLVEKDIIVAAQYTPERTEKRLVVECDEVVEPEEATA